MGRARGGWICFGTTRICLGGRVRRRTKCKMLQRLALHRTAAAAAHPRIIRLRSLASVASATEGEVDVVARGAAPIPRSLAGHHTRPAAAAAAALTAARSAARWYLNLVTTISGVPRRLAAVAIGTKGEIDVITRRTPPVSIATAPALAATLAAAAAALHRAARRRLRVVGEWEISGESLRPFSHSGRPENSSSSKSASVFMTGRVCGRGLG